MNRTMPYLEYCCLVICREEAQDDKWWGEPYKMGNPFTRAPRWKSKIEMARKRWPVLREGY